MAELSNMSAEDVARVADAMAVKYGLNVKATKATSTPKVKVFDTIKSVGQDTFDGEKVVNRVQLGGVRATASNNGVMANFNSISGGKNYLVFIKQDWVENLARDKTYLVSEHTSKASGKTSHAIHIGRKACAYASAKQK
jgi:hypothetical protein